MVARFLDAGHRAAWVVGDEVDGGDPKPRTALKERGTGYVLAVACSSEPQGEPASSVLTPWPRRSPSGPGRSCQRGPERRATASATGPSSTSPPPGPGAARR
ncbi:hypothetical protein [Streptomyces sp. NPDC102283]|uniref:hypothetical protein n=1 Tax=Streptomyces sp. NPDC102283 TaxID=3366155 RepID=UPI0037F7D37A